jgi:predicted alpha/beta superfamily hydrolase
MQMLRIFFIAIVALAASGANGQVPKVSSGRIERIDSFPSKYIDTRNIDVWLPPGYPAAGKYDVLYMHDGQMLFDSTITWNRQEWQVDETISRLITEKKIRPVIVVAIPNNGRLRMAEYFPQKAARKLPVQARDSLLKDVGGKLLADQYLSFLVKELKPFIDSAYATNASKAHTFIAGASMGGLISLYAICQYPRSFGGAACISTHWPGSFRGLNDGGLTFNAISNFVKKELPSVHTRHLLYMDHGDKTLDSFYTLLQPKIDSLINSKGYKKNQFLSRIFPEADHSEISWAARLDQPMLFLLGKK